jgi:transmembrane sensor
MTRLGTFGDDVRRTEAADWFVRLQTADLAEDDALAFDAWVADAANARAFDAVLSVSREFVFNARAIAGGLSERRGARPAGRRALIGFGVATAAAAAVAVVVPQLTSTKTETYVTAKGKHRSVALADGSTIDLNGGTTLSVTLARDARRVTLDHGQAVFDVARDLRKPFLIAAGDRTVRVVGTQFDVRRLDGKLSVTVARGVVEVRPIDGAAGSAYRLHPGQRLEHAEGQAAARVAAAEPAEVLGWRAGRLVYRDQPLKDVVADLNQQFATPIRIEDKALAETPISGVLVLDNQDAVIRRLALLVPVRAVPSGSGLVLRREGSAGR